MLTLYKLTFGSGKSYIGQTVRRMETRLAQHRRAANANSGLAVHLAWAKYGEPDVAVLGLYETQAALNNAERLAIIEAGTLSPGGYNLGFGGETAPSKSPAVASKIAAKARGRRHSVAAKDLISNKSKQAWADPDYRKKVADGIAASWTDDVRAAHSSKMKEAWVKRKANGFVVSDATKKKLSERKFSDEAKQKMSAAAKGRKRGPRSMETRQKLSDSCREQWRNPEIRARRSAAIRAGHAARKARQELA